MITLYLYENVIQYKEKEKVKEYYMKENAMEYGKVKNIPIFEEHLRYLVKKEHWTSLLKPKKIFIILPIQYEEVDKEVLSVIFNNVGLKEVRFVKEVNLYKLKNNQVIFNLHRSYATIVKKIKGKITKNIYYKKNFQSIKDMVDHILNQFNTKYRFYFLGSFDQIPELIKEKKINRLFYYHDYKNYLINKMNNEYLIK